MRHHHCNSAQFDVLSQPWRSRDHDGTFSVSSFLCCHFTRCGHMIRTISSREDLPWYRGACAPGTLLAQADTGRAYAPTPKGCHSRTGLQTMQPTRTAPATWHTATTIFYLKARTQSEAQYAASTRTHTLASQIPAKVMLPGSSAMQFHNEQSQSGSRVWRTADAIPITWRLSSPDLAHCSWSSVVTLSAILSCLQRICPALYTAGRMLYHSLPLSIHQLITRLSP